MDTDQIASLLYLSVLLVAIGGWFFVRNRNNLGQLAQMAALWGLIFLGVIAAKGLWDDIRRTTIPSQIATSANAMELPRAPDGHFYAFLEVNGTPIRFMVDTGATQIVMTQRDAARAGLNPENLPYLGRAETANGTVKTAQTKADTIAFGPFLNERVDVSINGAEMDTSLLGMRYLDLFDRVEISRDRLILSRD